MKRCISTYIPQCKKSPIKRKRINYTADDVFALSFLIEFTGASIDESYDMADDLEDLVAKMEQTYKLHLKQDGEGLIQAWFAILPDEKKQALVMKIFNVYLPKVKDPTDKRYICLVDVYCMAFNEPAPTSRFGYIIKYSEIKNKIDGGVQGRVN